jgi:hypothetical protein
MLLTVGNLLKADPFAKRNPRQQTKVQDAIIWTEVEKTDREPQEVSKEVVGIHVLLTRSLFGDIPHR